MKKILYLLSILLLASCSQKVIPNKPIPGQFSEPPLAKESAIQIPITISIVDINKYIEASIPAQIYSGKESGKDKMQVNLLFGQVAKEYNWEVEYSVKKNGKIDFNIDKDGSILFRLPLRIDANGCASIALGTQVKKCGESNPEIDMLIKTKISINPDYSVTSKTSIAYDLKKAILVIPFNLGNFPLFNLKLNIKDDLQKPIDGQLKNIATKVDDYVAKYMSDMKLKQLASNYWNEYSTSMNISNDPALFLNIEPKKVMFEDIHKESNSLQASIGFSAILSVSSSPKKIEKIPLPNLQYQKMNSNSLMYIPIVFDYDSLERILNKKFIDTTLIGNGYKLTVKGIDMFGSGKNIVVNVDYQAKIKGVMKKVKGNMYFNTLPAFDLSTNTFYLENCVLSSETNSLLTDRGLKWVANKSLNTEIMKMSRYCINNDINTYKKMINDYIKNVKMGKFEINGVVNKIDFEGFFVEPSRIQIYFKGVGKIQSKVSL
ncbi:MAG: hypothetical protein AUJ98_10495 [Bacteroidetes bacterium CG2_30_33_31]|nr:MAG: hypothetical protein AUJ98_10495 [Bacteroidetes bacterium CG2_30_33_31]